VPKVVAKASAPKGTAPPQPRAARIAAIPKPPSIRKPDNAPTEAPTNTAPDGTIIIGFGATSSDIPSSAASPLDRLVKRMKDDPRIRVRLNGYASAKIDSPSQARRKSLFRALAIRKYLMSKGIRSTRIDIHALGNKSEGDNPNRVDVVIRKSRPGPRPNSSTGSSG
jgi:outer membrane protein OmpA-like peptidoglycan-associated protein